MLPDPRYFDHYVKQLNDVGFTWDVFQDDFNEGFKDLVAFETVHNHCNVPSNFPENPRLAAWVKQLRKHYVCRVEKNIALKNKLTDEHIKQMEDIGFY